MNRQTTKKYEERSRLACWISKTARLSSRSLMVPLSRCKRARSPNDQQRWSSMYLSDRDLEWAIRCGRLIIKPQPTKIDATSIDLHLDSVEKARVWDIARYQADNPDAGHEALE